MADRLKFRDFAFERLPNGRCRARVVLAWGDGREFEGEAEGVTSPAGEMRCAAVATVQALEAAVEPKVGFDLLGTKAVRAFDATVVIVSLTVKPPGSGARLVGVYLTETELPRGAALAVLNATNRMLGNYLVTR